MLKKFATFFFTYSVTTPFPVSEGILCYFSTYMACQGLSPQTIKVYLAGIRHMKISIGLPDPKEFTSMPRLRMAQSGIQRCVSEQDSKVTKIRLPITPTILLQMWDYWLPKSTDPDVKMLWAAAIICFFGFFRSLFAFSDFFDLEKSQFQVLHHSIQRYIWPGVISQWMIQTPLQH